MENEGDVNGRSRWSAYLLESLMTRRRFLAYSGSVAVGGVLLDRYGTQAALAGLDSEPAAFPLPGAFGVPLTWMLRRPHDQLSLGFEFYNLTLNTNDIANPVLVPTNLPAPAYVVVVFPPQSLVEEAVFDTAGSSLESSPDTPVPGADSPPVQSRPSRVESRLAFRKPSAIASIPFNSQSLLSWSQWTQSIVPSAVQLDCTPDPEPGARSHRVGRRLSAHPSAGGRRDPAGDPVAADPVPERDGGLGSRRQPCH